MSTDLDKYLHQGAIHLNQSGPALLGKPYSISIMFLLLEIKLFATFNANKKCNTSIGLSTWNVIAHPIILRIFGINIF